ncbi:aminoglycoside phosphotransferase family protein [Leifsonia xyli]|uniref:aminoglycoside phosphotransferase family protein n=1 Tax=Leifsonia xyli TaxID=1575 RepID=UPI003D664E8B
MSDADAALAPLRERWGLAADGPAFATEFSVLQPVSRGERGLFLKRATSAEERVGTDVLAWWEGRGAATVLARYGDAALLERASGVRDLAALSRSGPEGDDEATRILCRTMLRLHEAGTPPRPDGLFSLRRWFRDLLDGPHAGADAELFAQAGAVAEDLLADPVGDVVLHGDLHHGNVLDFRPGGWRAIDPKPLHGDPGFDVANILCNPDASTALVPGRLERTVAVIAAETSAPERRVLRWALAWGGLSATWSRQSGGDDTAALGVARRARERLGG